MTTARAPSKRERLTQHLEQYLSSPDESRTARVSERSATKIQELLAAGASPDVAVRGVPLVVMMVSWGRSALSRQVLAAGALVDAEGFRQETALHRAVHLRDAEHVDVLIGAGATMDLRDETRSTPLALACGRGARRDAFTPDLAIIASLLGAGASPATCDWIPRQVSCLDRGVEVLRQLDPALLVDCLAGTLAQSGPASAWAAEHLSRMGAP